MSVGARSSDPTCAPLHVVLYWATPNGRSVSAEGWMLGCVVGQRLRRVGFAAVSGLGGCGWFGDGPLWTDQLSADSPCFDVNLVDGLDEEDTAELHTAFACLNRGGHLDAFVGVDAAFDVPTRKGSPLGLVAVRGARALATAGLPVTDLFGEVVDMWTVGRPLVTTVSDVTAELIFGATSEALREDGVPGDLRWSVLTPWRQVLPEVAAVWLDEPMAATAVPWAQLAASTRTKRAVYTFAAMADSDHPEVVALRHDLPYQLGLVLREAGVVQGGPGEPPDVLRDAVSAWFDPSEDVVGRLLSGSAGLLGDPVFREELQPRLVSMAEAGVFATLPDRLAWIASMDADGEPLVGHRMSVLGHLLHLVEATNVPVECTIEIAGGRIDVSFPNMAVSVMDLLADQQPRQVADVVGLIEDVLGLGLVGLDLGAIAESGTCPVITKSLIRDMDALRQLDDSRGRDLMRPLVWILKAAKAADSGHFRDIADMVSLVSASGVVPSTEALIRALGPTLLAEQLASAAPVFLDPDAYGLDTPIGPAFGVDDVFDLVLLMGRANEQGWTPWDGFRALVLPIVHADGSWRSFGRTVPLLVDDASSLHGAGDVLPRALVLDPDLVSLDVVADIAELSDAVQSLMYVLDARALTDALLATRGSGDAADEAPLAYVGRLLVDGTWADLLQMIDLSLTLMSDVLSEQDT